jgi:RecB family exonuclease
MEDFHGERNFAHPRDAFKAYVKATHRLAKAKRNPHALPVDWPQLYQLGIEMINYYVDTWLIARDPLKTFWYNGKPQVEVHALVEVPFKNEFYEKVLYGLTIDRVVEDADGGLWLLDYKTAKRIQTHFFQTDPQISAYMWVANHLYPGRRIEGFIYQQHRKDVAHEPPILGGGRISASRNQLTTHRLYRKALKNLYGDVLKAPQENIDLLNWLNEQETEDQDKFIHRARIFRNQHQCESEGALLLLELEDMLNLNLALYPNPTRECGHMCSFNSACVSMNDGGDWAYELQIGFEQKTAIFDNWREYLE